MDAKRCGRIVVLGVTHWCDVAATLLRRGGQNAEVLHDTAKLMGLSWVFSKPFYLADVVHVVWGGHLLFSVVSSCLFRKKLVWHWIGSDVLRHRQRTGFVGWLARFVAKKLVRLHLADSPDVAK